MSTIVLKKKKKSKNKSIYPYIFLFFLGFLILIYPLISQMYYRIDSNHIVRNFDDVSKKLKKEEIENRIKLAELYNETLDPTKIVDPYSEDTKKGIAEYARMLEVHELIGHIEIPKIGEDLPIYAGTSETVLQKGAGHLEGTSLPIGGIGTHSVITAHRGLATAKMFRQLDELEIGDVFLVHNIEKTLAYEVDQILTVEPSNFDPVLVSPKEDYCTLLTCTPYVINSHRLLVRGHRVEYNEEVVKQEFEKAIPFWREYLLYFIIFVIILLMILLYLIYRKRRKNEK